ncbi:TetR/AcrR family transcriptional regulator [Paenibacillus sp. MMS18-CY102]|uniref:TetR/AcrR family transcriptional regulator n=1 Tax=Paenibacillus sp. MMS18-CY102 TaxID=2682849 RepID=UPI0013653C42|nr:TetR/AcrR family transcriptional regulator [Paenibacillus sp. MMS18-CY102]MWC31189.1 TetR family transcriptional regulator [Paenibacillus sp. MMS18-CY102]
MATPKRKDAQQLTELILDTARELFTEHGVDAVSMHQIAKTAGVGQATLYRRYTQKADLCLELMDDHFNRFKNDVVLLLEQLEQSEESTHTRLKALVRRLVQFSNDESALLHAIHATITPLNCIENEKKSFFQYPPYVFLHGTLSTLLKEALDSGQTVPFDPAFNAHILITALAPHTLQHLHQEYGYTTDQIVEKLCMALINPLFKS